MTDIQATDVMKLRKLSGVGMMDCKKALVESEGDFEKAIIILRKTGQKMAEKRAHRESTEGVALSIVNDSKTIGVSIILGCETDFVAKNEDFISLAKKLNAVALNYKTKEKFLASEFEGNSISEKLIEQTGILGEKIEITDFKRVEAPFVGCYIHTGNRIASLIGLSKILEAGESLAKDIAMQIASMGATLLSYRDFDPIFVDNETELRVAAIKKENDELKRLGKILKNIPQYISRSQLSDEVLAKASDEAKSQLKSEGKPEKIWDKILPGKIERFISDNTTLDRELCLLDQQFIKDDKKTVFEYIQSVDDQVEILSFSRVSLLE